MPPRAPDGQTPYSPITTHVLDTSVGRPASGLLVHLTLEYPAIAGPWGEASPRFMAVTDADGRIMKWSSLGGPSMEEVIDTFSRDRTRRAEWVLQFSTGAYYGIEKTLFPTVDVKMFVKNWEEDDEDRESRGEDWKMKRKYHVPLLLGPWSYSVYRGS